MIDFDRMTKKFIIGEKRDLGVRSYIQAMKETIAQLRPSSQSQAILVENMKTHLRSIRKEVVSLSERVSLLEEQITVLEESKEK